MSVRVSADIFCDICGNWESAYPDISKRAVRARFRKKGWVVKRLNGRLQDVCPACLPAHLGGDE